MCQPPSFLALLFFDPRRKDQVTSNISFGFIPLSKFKPKYKEYILVLKSTNQFSHFFVS